MSKIVINAYSNLDEITLEEMSIRKGILKKCLFQRAPFSQHSPYSENACEKLYPMWPNLSPSFFNVGVEWFLLGTSNFFGTLIIVIEFGDNYMTRKCLWQIIGDLIWFRFFGTWM
jgi:hypothetical protein